MKKQSILLLFLILILSSSLVSTQNTTVNIKNNTNPITNFMKTEIASDSFRFIGAPTELNYQNLIIYLLFILIAYIIIADILNGINLFNKKWIQNSISLIIVLLGIYSGTAYSLIVEITQIGASSIYLSALSYYIILGAFGLYLLFKAFVKIMKRSNRTAKEKAEERADKIATLRKIQDIQARAEGIK